MRIRHRHNRGVLDDGSAADGGHSPLPHHADAVARNRSFEGHVSSVHEGECSLVFSSALSSLSPTKTLIYKIHSGSLSFGGETRNKVMIYKMFMI